jgi:glyoxylase-like metal-dependent hydrolase (beta-lactamase superfamily II)
MVTRITAPAQHAAWVGRTLPGIEVLPGGIVSAPVPVPDNPIRYTLCYLLLGDDREVVVVDPGWDTDEGIAILLEALQAVDRAPTDVVGIVATHVHPDHHGAARRLRDFATSSWVAMSREEAEALARQRRPPEQRRAAEHAWRRTAGVAPGDAGVADLGADRADLFARMPAPTLLLADGDRVPLRGREVRVLATPGHTAGHLCLVDVAAGVVLTGDHLLPRISPNVGLTPISGRAPLRDYLDSLHRLDALDLEALPGHQWRFRGVPERAAELRAHHAARLDEIADALGTGAVSAAKLAPRLSWAHPWATLTPFQCRAAIAETIAHLEHLVGLGRADQDGDAPRRYRIRRHDEEGT